MSGRTDRAAGRDLANITPSRQGGRGLTFAQQLGVTSSREAMEEETSVFPQALSRIDCAYCGESYAYGLSQHTCDNLKCATAINVAIQISNKRVEDNRRNHPAQAAWGGVQGRPGRLQDDPAYIIPLNATTFLKMIRNREHGFPYSCDEILHHLKQGRDAASALHTVVHVNAENESSIADCISQFRARFGNLEDYVMPALLANNQESGHLKRLRRSAQESRLHSLSAVESPAMLIFRVERRANTVLRVLYQHLWWGNLQMDRDVRTMTIPPGV